MRPLKQPHKVVVDPRVRLMAKVDRTPTCWNWTAAMDRSGYGKFSWGHGKWIGAHRASYELFVGPIPEGKQLDHLCRNRRCVRPSHLEPVTCRTNILRGDGPSAQQARQTHCRYGHPFAGANLYVTQAGRRKCRECERFWSRSRYWRRQGRVITRSVAA